MTFKLNFDLEFRPPPLNANCPRMTNCHCRYILYTCTLYTYTLIINNQHKNPSKRGPVLVLSDYYTRSNVNVVSQVKYIRIRILKSGIKDSLRIMLVKRKIRKILSKSLISYFLNSLNEDKEILVKRSPGPDQLPNTYLQATAEETAPILSAILTNLSEQANYRLIGLLQRSAPSLRKVTSTFPVIIGQFL